MSSEIIHLIVRAGSNDRDLYATSPQAPGLLYGRPTLRELRDDLQEVLEFHFEQPGPFTVQEHHERHYDVAGGELVTRMAIDECADVRQVTCEVLGRAVAANAEQAEGLVSAPVNAVGEVVYICAVMSDTVGWIMDQLDPHGDVVNVAVSVANLMVVTLPFAYGEAVAPEGMVSLGAKSYTLETKLTDVIQDLEFVRPMAVNKITICA
ncbi:hypothetical protein AB0F88_16890 [Streptosporangium sp. NPDC023963]|uniref:hypothetical protein n=1 Tax=Streptosporangium sp. NPDC023963 TaxID=3155608 RepID=UPI00341454CE